MQIGSIKMEEGLYSLFNQVMNNSRLNVSSVSRQSLVHLTSNNPERKSEAKAKKQIKHGE
ncbi:hypothetical protein AST16_10790 [Staphylococcus xylosus]|nr:hypothetical protein AST16_10790 [Staphylococcus xylosus]